VLRLETFLRLRVNGRDSVDGVEELGSGSLSESDSLEVRRKLGEGESSDEDWGWGRVSTVA
jgi:hypothetical protein